MSATEAPEMTACLTLRLRTSLFVCGVKRASAGTVLRSYQSPGYDRNPGWIVEVDGKVVELFVGDFEMLTVQRIEVFRVPAMIRKYTAPDARGFTTMPYRADQRADWH